MPVLRYQSADTSTAPQITVIAEIGVNHDGSIERALELTQAAANAGADAVKLQYFDPKRLLSNQAILAAYQKNAANDPVELLSKLTLDLQAITDVAQQSQQLGLSLIVTPFSLDDVDELSALAEAELLDAIKIASPDAVNLPLIERAANLNLPLIVSTGTCDLDELQPAVDILNQHAPGYALMQCVSAYPTPNDAAALSGINLLAETYHCPVGYSDHTTDPQTGARAVAAGAQLIEKHVTYDPKAPGPDHAASFDPDQLQSYIQNIRTTQAMLGPAAKTLTPPERDVRQVSRQSLCLTQSLPADHILTREDLTIKRPGTGIPANQLTQTLGQKLNKPKQANDLLNPDELA